MHNDAQISVETVERDGENQVLVKITSDDGVQGIYLNASGVNSLVVSLLKRIKTKVV